MTMYGVNLKFTADAKAPYFTYFLKKNSRDKNTDALTVLEKFLRDMKDTLLEKAES